MVTVDEKYLNLTAKLCKEVKDASYKLSNLSYKSHYNWDVLEIGCGTGVDVLRIAKMLPESQILGIDFDAKLIEYAKEKSLDSGLTNTTLVQQDLYDLKAVQAYDFIRAERVIQHLPNIDKAFDIISKALKPSGRLTIIDANWSKLECAAFTKEQNLIVQDIYTEQLINKVNKEFLEQHFRRVEISNVKTELINIGLSTEDYLNASQFEKLIKPKLSQIEADQMLHNINLLNDAEVIGMIEMIVTTGTKSN